MRTLLAAIALLGTLSAAAPTEAQTQRYYGFCAMSFAGSRGVHLTPIFTLNRDAVAGRSVYERVMGAPGEVHQSSSNYSTDVQGEFKSYVETQGRSRDYDGGCYFGASAQVLKDWRASRPSDYPTEVSLLRDWLPVESAWAIIDVEQWEGR